MLYQILIEVQNVRDAQKVTTLAISNEVIDVAEEIELIKNFLWQNRGSFEKEVLAKFFDYTAGAAATVAAAPEIQQLAGFVRKMILKD